MVYYLARCPIELPTKRPNLMAAPRFVRCTQYEQPSNIIGRYSNTKKYGIGAKLSARHPLHSKTDLQFLLFMQWIVSPMNPF